MNSLPPGREVLCVDIHANARPITVGRAKNERRPMVCIRARVALGDEKIAAEPQDCVYLNAFLQNDWHVRLMGADGKVRHSTLLRPGDEILAHVDVPGRHTGLKVTENIVEKQVCFRD